MNIMGKKVAYFRKIDDTLGVFHTHCVAGFVGGICVGLFATIEGCAAFGASNLGGAIEGNGKQVYIQLYGALFVIGWNIVWTSLIMIFIKYVCRIPLRMTQEQMEVGDYAVHGEEPYTFAHYNIKHPTPLLRRRTTTKKSDEESSKAGVLMGKDPNPAAADKAPSSGDSITEVKGEKGVTTGASTELPVTR